MTPTIPASTITGDGRQAAAPSQTFSVFHEMLHLQQGKREREREKMFDAALQSCVSPPIARVVRAVWGKIQGCVPGVVRVPRLDVREEGGVLLTWDQGVHHLDVEVLPDASLDFFYLNRETNETWDVETTLQEQARLPEKVLQHFNHFRLIV